MSAPPLLAVAEAVPVWQNVLDILLIGLSNGALYALVALGYTMVYGIIELINFAHGDVVMLGACLALVLARALLPAEAGAAASAGCLLLMLLAVPLFCAGLNFAIDRLVYRPLRSAPKLAPLVSAIGVSFVLMNVGLLWRGASPERFPGVVSEANLVEWAGWGSGVRFTGVDLVVILTTAPIMLALTWFVKFTALGRAMRATAQNPTAARLMGIDVDRVISATFLIGGALGGVGSVIYCLAVTNIRYDIGYTIGLYAFTAAVLGGIGNIPGAVLGGLVIGMVRAIGTQLVDDLTTGALIFGILIIILVFRPTGLLGTRMREKV